VGDLPFFSFQKIKASHRFFAIHAKVLSWWRVGGRTDGRAVGEMLMYFFSLVKGWWTLVHYIIGVMHSSVSSGRLFVRHAAFISFSLFSFFFCCCSIEEGKGRKTNEEKQ
jgi:hypothetical protein